MIAPDFSDFYSVPLVGILRGTATDTLPHIVQAVRKGGMRYLEITMNSPGAEDQIRAARELAIGSLKIGAGTVTSPTLLDRALAAGAEFIVTPAVVREVIESCEAAGIPIFPGALTPTEIYAAWKIAPNLIPAVKIFPADFGGPNYIRALKGPFPHIPLMPTGGVNLQTLPAFIKAGAQAFGIGSPLFHQDKLEARDWTWLENQVRAFVETYRSTAPSLEPAKT
ncbi:MAG: bifunctional 4-hydroxy-2-oxoglutarate aldolase/2-dehydro-3-deoxy-phosphogluconate aldolase [Limisphaerales bacterium]